MAHLLGHLPHTLHKLIHRKTQPIPPGTRVNTHQHILNTTIHYTTTDEDPQASDSELSNEELPQALNHLVPRNTHTPTDFAVHTDAAGATPAQAQGGPIAHTSVYQLRLEALYKHLLEDVEGAYPLYTGPGSLDGLALDCQIRYPFRDGTGCIVQTVADWQGSGSRQGLTLRREADGRLKLYQHGVALTEPQTLRAAMAALEQACGITRNQGRARFEQAVRTVCQRLEIDTQGRHPVLKIRPDSIVANHNAGELLLRPIKDNVMASDRLVVKLDRFTNNDASVADPQCLERALRVSFSHRVLHKLHLGPRCKLDYQAEGDQVRIFTATEKLHGREPRSQDELQANQVTSQLALVGHVLDLNDITNKIASRDRSKKNPNRIAHNFVVTTDSAELKAFDLFDESQDHMPAPGHASSSVSRVLHISMEDLEQVINSASAQVEFELLGLKETLWPQVSVFNERTYEQLQRAFQAHVAQCLKRLHESCRD